MATIRAYTDLEQSKKLAEILPLESADAVIWGRNLEAVAVTDAQKFMIGLKERKMDYLPCWSLAALLGVLQYPTLLQREDKKWECTAWIDFTKPHSIPPKGSPIDACYEMILKLHELKML